MQDLLMTLVFMLVFIMFSIWPAIKIVDFISKKRELSEKSRNYLTLFLTLLIALLAALFMKF